MMKRRDFLKTSAAVSATTIAAPYLILSNKTLAAPVGAAPDLVAVRNGRPAAMVDKAIAAFGGMAPFVKKGQTVVVKPNIAWDRSVETGANTNPEVVKRVVELCLQAGAKKVYVLDHTVNSSLKCYEKSGVGPATKAAGGILVPASTKGDYQKTKITGGKKLKETAVHELILEADAFINIPVLKHHKSTKLSVSMKNLMGCVWDRRAYHKNNLQQCIADFLMLKKPTLNIVDAYRVTLRNGPQRAKPEDVVTKKVLLASADIVAVDAAAAKIHGTDPSKVDHIRIAHAMKIGNMDLSKLKIKRIAM